MSLVFINIGKVVHQIKTLSEFRARVNRRMRQQRGNYESMARRFVRIFVYSFPVNPRYPRSGNTEAAVYAKAIKGTGDSTGVDIGLDPVKAKQNFAYTYHRGVKPQGLLSYYRLTGRGGFKYYPSYVRRGIIFRRRGPSRDFKAGWAINIGEKFRRDSVAAIRGRA